MDTGLFGVARSLSSSLPFKEKHLYTYLQCRFASVAGRCCVSWRNRLVYKLHIRKQSSGMAAFQQMTRKAFRGIYEESIEVEEQCLPIDHRSIQHVCVRAAEWAWCALCCGFWHVRGGACDAARH